MLKKQNSESNVLSESGCKITKWLYFSYSFVFFLSEAFKTLKIDTKLLTSRLIRNQSRLWDEMKSEGRSQMVETRNQKL